MKTVRTKACAALASHSRRRVGLVEADDGMSREGDKLPGAAPRRYTEPILSV